MKNIHLLPTDKPSRLCFRYYLFINKDNIGTYSNVEFKNIYITNSEEIKEGDWYYWTVTNSVQKAKKDNLKRLPKISDGSHKIILTTDDQLIADGVQAIDDEFLGWFIQNPSCESVEVTYNKDAFPYGVETSKEYGWYKIIIPQEEPKQETLEEAAENYAKDIGNKNGTAQFDFKKGANWQKERMYSEEEVRQLLITQRGNCYVAILNKTNDIELAKLTITAPEPNGGNWVK